MPDAISPDLPAAPPPRVWIEVTSTDNKQGGPGWGLGECLWSPSAFSNGADAYATMRQVQTDDLVLHLADSKFAGCSAAAGPFEEFTNEPPQPGKWAGRPLYYRVKLKGVPPVRQSVDAQSASDTPPGRNSQ